MSVPHAAGRSAATNDRFRDARLFYVSYAAAVAIALAVILIPCAPLIPILFLTQALNAALLLGILPLLRALARDPEVMGDHAIGRGESIVTAAVIVLVAVSVATLAVASLT